MSSYHLSEKASGLSASISSEKCMYCSALNESGRITKSGAIKKKKTRAQINK